MNRYRIIVAGALAQRNAEKANRELFEDRLLEILGDIADELRAMAESQSRISEDVNRIRMEM